MRKNYTLIQKLLRSKKNSRRLPEEVLTPKERLKLAKICGIAAALLFNTLIIIMIIKLS